MSFKYGVVDSQGYILGSNSAVQCPKHENSINLYFFAFSWLHMGIFSITFRRLHPEV